MVPIVIKFGNSQILIENALHSLFFLQDYTQFFKVNNEDFLSTMTVKEILIQTNTEAAKIISH